MTSRSGVSREIYLAVVIGGMKIFIKTPFIDPHGIMVNIKEKCNTRDI